MGDVEWKVCLTPLAEPWSSTLHLHITFQLVVRVIVYVH